MEAHEKFVVLLLVFTLLSWGQTDQRSGTVGCPFCKPNEDCYRDPSYPYWKCRRIQIRKPVEEDLQSDIKYETFKDFHERSPNAGVSDEDESYRKYDMTYFEDHEAVSEIPDEKREAVGKEETKSELEKVLNRVQRNQHHIIKNRQNVHQGALDNFERKKTFRHGENKDNSWPPIGIPMALPEKRDQPVSQNDERALNHNKRTSESDKAQKNREIENSLDVDIVIKPLSLSDSKYYEEEKTKLSSIPKKPITEKIEHIQTNIVDSTPTKKAKVGILIGGKLNKAKANIVQDKSPDQTYDKVKDFFKSQQVSSIVDAPDAEKRESVKFYSLSSGENDVNVKRSSIPSPPVYSDGIRLHLKERLNRDKASNLLNTLQDLLWGSNQEKTAFTSVETEDNAVLFHMINNTTTRGQQPSSVVERINRGTSLKSALSKAAGVTVLSASLQSESTRRTHEEDSDFMITTLIVAGCVSAILLASVCIFIILKRSQDNSRWILKPVGQEAASDYQSLWRQLRQATWDSPIRTPPVAHSDSGDQKANFGYKGQPPKYSWSEEPVDTKMDISTGHAVLAYMEDHLKNENRLSKEWEDLSVYEAEPNQTDVGKDVKNSKKNRYSDVLPYDHNRVKLRETSNATGSDYINASYIIDDDPRNPAYIATQGPLASTVADFWQMVWEQGVVVIVMLTKLADLGLPQCHRYWPEKGHDVYHIYQVHLISEHIWCSDYLVRSFYLKNVETGETRTVTQFHYLTWPHLGIPISSKPLLDFRRKVLKCFRSHSCPVVVHCSGGIDRTGTYILIDMVLGKMSRGTKEIDIAATLEHLRDQRPHMVKTKAQFEFALTSVAEEVNAILQVLTKH